MGVHRPWLSCKTKWHAPPKLYLLERLEAEWRASQKKRKRDEVDFSEFAKSRLADQKCEISDEDLQRWRQTNNVSAVACVFSRRVGGGDVLVIL